MRIDPHLQVEVVESTDKVITAHLTLTIDLKSLFV